MFRKKLVRFLLLSGSALIAAGILLDDYTEICFILAGIMILMGSWFNSRKG